MVPDSVTTRRGGRRKPHPGPRASHDHAQPKENQPNADQTKSVAKKTLPPLPRVATIQTRQTRQRHRTDTVNHPLPLRPSTKSQAISMAMKMQMHTSQSKENPVANPKTFIPTTTSNRKEVVGVRQIQETSTTAKNKVVAKGSSAGVTTGQLRTEVSETSANKTESVRTSDANLSSTDSQIRVTSTDRDPLEGGSQSAIMSSLQKNHSNPVAFASAMEYGRQYRRSTRKPIATEKDVGLSRLHTVTSKFVSPAVSQTIAQSQATVSSPIKKKRYVKSPPQDRKKEVSASPTVNQSPGKKKRYVSSPPRRKHVDDKSSPLVRDQKKELALRSMNCNNIEDASSPLPLTEESPIISSSQIKKCNSEDLPSPSPQSRASLILLNPSVKKPHAPTQEEGEQRLMFSPTSIKEESRKSLHRPDSFKTNSSIRKKISRRSRASQQASSLEKKQERSERPNTANKSPAKKQKLRDDADSTSASNTSTGRS